MASGGVRNTELLELQNKQLTLENGLLREDLSALDIEHQQLQLQSALQRERLSALGIEHQQLQLQSALQRERLSALDIEHQQLQLQSALQQQELVRCLKVQAFLLERAKQQQVTGVPPEKDGEQLIYARFGLNMPKCDGIPPMEVACKSDEEIIVNEVTATLLMHGSRMNVAQLGIHLTGKFREQFLRVKIKHNKKLCAFLAGYTKNFAVNVKEQTISVRT